MALRASLQSTVVSKASSSRVARAAAVARSPPAPKRAAVLARASSQQPEEDPSAKLQEQLNDAVKYVQTKWEETSDAEKPAAVAIIVGAVIAQIAVGATVDAVDRIPIIHQFLEFVGLAVTVVYAYRYFTDPAERDNVKKSVESFVDAVTGTSK